MESQFLSRFYTRRRIVSVKELTGTTQLKNEKWPPLQLLKRRISVGRNPVIEIPGLGHLLRLPQLRNPLTKARLSS
jgi:hypothetical protein